MPPKITAKNLQYNTTLPPFLARLRGEATSSSEFDGGGPDPILAARRRPTKKRSGSAEAEDAPTIVDEHGNTVQDVTVGVDGSVKATASAPAEEEKGGHDDSKPAAENQAQAKAASIGAVGKKRRVGKVVGADADEEDQKKDAAPTANTKAEDKEGTASAPKTKPKRKAKKIKLSFGDDEG